MEQRPQVSATIDQELFNSIQNLADKENRSISAMVYLLLQKAVKEKSRKRKSATKDDNS